MRLVVIAFALPAMFIAMGLAALFIPYCGLSSSMVAAYLVLLPLVRYAKDHLYLRLRYFMVALLAFGAIWALEAALEPLLRDYRSSLDFLIQAMSTCPQWRVYLFVTAVILAPIVEEVLFRVLLYTELEKRAGPLVGYVGNSLAFALLHGLPTLLPLYFIYGVILTYAFRRGGVISAVVLHGANNFLVFTTL